MARPNSQPQLTQTAPAGAPIEFPAHLRRASLDPDAFGSQSTQLRRNLPVELSPGPAGIAQDRRISQPTGFEVAYALTQHAEIRGDTAWLQFSWQNPLTILAHTLEPRLLGVSLVADFFPEQSGWFITTSVRLNGNRLRRSSAIDGSMGSTAGLYVDAGSEAAAISEVVAIETAFTRPEVDFGTRDLRARTGYPVQKRAVTVRFPRAAPRRNLRRLRHAEATHDPALPTAAGPLVNASRPPQPATPVLALRLGHQM